MIMNTGMKGIPLSEIIQKLGNKEYDTIMVRCKWTCNNEHFDELFGYCSYHDGILTPLDYDTYSLNDLYIEYEEEVINGELVLIVWAYGEPNEI